MMVEIGIGVLLTLVGFAVLAPLGPDIGPWPRLWLALPMGAAVYLLVALTALAVVETLNPIHALVATAGIGVLGAVPAARRATPGPGPLVWAVGAVSLAVVTVLVARTFHLTRLSPDSFRYLLFASDMRLPDALNEIHRPDLIIRQMGLPSLQALSALTDRRYLASIGPLFGVSGLGFFIWAAWWSTRHSMTHRRLGLVAFGALFLWASNRLVYDAFYINTHIQVAVYLLIAITGVWLAVSTRIWLWAIPAGLALGVTLLFRPEAPIVAGIVLVALGASRALWPTRIWLIAPTLFVGALWYGVILWRHGSGGDRISLAAPVFVSLVVILGSVLIVLAGGVGRLSSLVRYADRAMLGAMSVTLLVMSAREPDLLLESLEATALNLTGRGLWMLTWPAAIGLLVIALWVHRVPNGRIWTTPILGFGLLFWLLPLARGGAWRVGEGDSGNRILAHILAVVVVFLLLAAIDSWPSQIEEAGDGPNSEPTPVATV